MQNTSSGVGVSPAYFISRFGETFGVQDVIDALPDLVDLDATAVQLEVYHRARLDEWTKRARELTSHVAAFGLCPSQFVAHFLGSAFASIDAMRDSRVISDFARVLNICDLAAVPVLTVPLSAFTEAYVPVARAVSECAGLLTRLSRMAADSGVRLALEVLPGSLPGGSRGYLQLIEEVDAPAPGFNLDTGHLHTAGEIVSHAIERLGDRIVGTHLCDNSGTENLSLAPGRGTIDWDATRDALSVTGYNGSFDVEIRCEATSVHDEYRHAIAFVREFFAPDARRSTAAQAQEE